MVSCMSSTLGTSHLVRFHNRVSAAIYKNLLEQHALNDQELNVMGWLAQSPDTIPIEKLW